MIATRTFEYRRVRLKPGDAFDCDDEHVKLLTVIGHAREPDAEKSGSQEYATRVMTATPNRRMRRSEQKKSA